MSKFNLELRIKVVTEYLSGKGSPSLAKKYRISNHAIILGWVHRFERRGIEGLKDRSMSQEYSSQFKVEVMDEHFETKTALIEAMNEWIDFYNHRRIKTKLDGKSPVKYRGLTAQKAA